MKRLIKKSIVFFSAAALVFNSGAAFADTNQAIGHFNALERIQGDLKNIESQISAFPIRSYYCNPPHKNDKRADRAALDALLRQATEQNSSITRHRRSLTNMIVNDGRARAAIGKLAPGGSGSIVDGSYFNVFPPLTSAAKSAYNAKQAALNNAPIRACGAAAAQPAPAFAIVNPITDVALTANYADAVFIQLPSKFCHRDEKSVWQDAITAQREKAQANEAMAERLRDRLRELHSQTAAKRQETWNAADAAAKSGKTADFNNHTAQLRAYDNALKKLAAAINTAIADIQRWKSLDLSLLTQSEVLAAMPITDCLNDDISSRDTLTFSGYDGFPESIPTISLKGMEVKDVEFIEVPEKTCFESMKRSYEMSAAQQSSNAYSNASLWSARLEAIRTELLRLNNSENPSTDLINKLNGARREAREEHAKWVKISAKTDAITEKAHKMKVEDCSGAGGDLEIGRLDPGFTELADEFPTPDLQAYDLPEIPARICTWEELQALRARAAKAREVSAHNRSEWGKRLVALGKALFQGENVSAYPTGPKYAAYLDAQLQVDYWSAQQEVAHKRYYDLMERNVDDCSKPEKKVSMGNGLSAPTGVKTGGDDKGQKGSRLGALQDAMNNRPVINGGKSSGYGDPFNPLGGGIIDQGGCLYPDPRLDGVYCPPNGSHGFDGSEAEHDLKHTLDGVELRHDSQDDHNNYEDRPSGPGAETHGANGNSGHVHTPDYNHGSPILNSDQPDTGQTGKSTPVETHKNSKSTITLPNSLGDIKLAPKPAGPVPMPYPNIGMPSDASRGGNKVNTDGTIILKNRPEFRTKAIDVDIQKQPVEVETQTLNGPTIYTVPNALGTKRAAPTLNIPSTNTNGRGTMIQVTPPPLIINSQGQTVSPVTNQELETATELQTGN